MLLLMRVDSCLVGVASWMCYMCCCLFVVGVRVCGCSVCAVRGCLLGAVCCLTLFGERRFFAR